MNCYYHAETAAVGICKFCNRGVCRDCGAEAGGMLSCRGRCEDETRALRDLMDRNKTAFIKAASSYYRSAVLLLALGAVMAGFGLFESHSLLTIVGSFLILSGFLTAYSGYKYGHK